MTRVAVVAEPLRLCLAIEEALKRKPDLVVVRLRMGDGDGGGLDSADVVLVSVPLRPAGRSAPSVANGRPSSSLGAVYSAGVVLLELSACTVRAAERAAAAPGETRALELSRPCRRRIVAAVRRARARRPVRRAPLVELRLDPSAPVATPGPVTSIDHRGWTPCAPRHSTPLVRTG